MLFIAKQCNPTVILDQFVKAESVALEKAVRQ